MVTDVLILLAGLLLVILGADWLVDGSSDIARRAGLSEFLIGMTIVGIGTSLPELVVSLTGALRGSADIAVGNVVVSNIFNVFLILGLTALVRPVAVSRDNKRKDIPLGIAAVVLLIGLGKIDGTLRAVEGAVLLLSFAAYMYLSFRTGKAEEDAAPDTGKKPLKLWLTIIMVLVGLGFLIFGGNLFVDSACRIAQEAGLSEKFIAITILALGTSLPELVTCLVAAVKGKSSLALGNIIGSNISNILLILGASALACPLSLVNIKAIDLGMLLLSSVILLISAWTGRDRIGRGDGAFYLLVFISYMTYLTLNI